MARQKMDVRGTEIALMVRERENYISLTGIAKYRNPAEPFAVINNWMRSRSTIEFLGLWERLSNPDFKPLEFERFKTEAGSTRCLSMKGLRNRNGCKDLTGPPSSK